MSGKRIYIAGPMTGFPQCNYPAFDAAEKHLKKKGYSVLNPANIGRTHFGGRIDLDDDELEWLLAQELEQLVECDAIFLLCGWEKSKGARKELYHAIGNGLEIMVQEKK